MPAGAVNEVAAATEGAAGVANKYSCSLFSMKKENASHEDEAVSRPLVTRGVMRQRPPQIHSWESCHGDLGQGFPCQAPSDLRTGRIRLPVEVASAWGPGVGGGNRQPWDDAENR